MSYFFSYTTGSFYPADPENPDQIHPAYKDVPNDLIAVDDDTFKKAIEARSHGASLSGSDGVLVITPVDPAVTVSTQSKIALAQYRSNIQNLLDKSDLVCLRCYKKGLPFPQEWVNWDNYLRSEISNDSADPTQPLSQTQPAYPAGT